MKMNRKREKHKYYCRQMLGLVGRSEKDDGEGIKESLRCLKKRTTNNENIKGS